MSGYKDPSIFPFLKELEKNWMLMRDEAANLEANLSKYQDLMDFTRYPSLKSVLYRTEGWNLLPFLVQRMKFTDFMRKYRMTTSDENPSEADLEASCKKVDDFFKTVFPKSMKIVDDFLSKHADQVTNIALFRLGKDKMLPVHTNYDPHMYRCHMGLIVPQGDIGMKVLGETRNWKEGEFFIFDSMQPHTVWNYTDGVRYVLDVDCFRPEYGRKDVLAVYEALFNLRMNEAKCTFGLSGGRSDLPKADKIKYACHHEEIPA